MGAKHACASKAPRLRAPFEKPAAPVCRCTSCIPVVDCLSSPQVQINAGTRAFRVQAKVWCRWGEVTDQFFLDQKLWFRASVLAERYWSSNETISAYCPGGCTYMDSAIQARLVKHRCRMLQRGVAAQPYGTQLIATRNRWAQCELFLPPAGAPLKTDDRESPAIGPLFDALRFRTPADGGPAQLANPRGGDPSRSFFRK